MDDWLCMLVMQVMDTEMNQHSYGFSYKNRNSITFSLAAVFFFDVKKTTAC